MFPNPNHFPIFLAKASTRLFVATSIIFKFSMPERDIGGRKAVMPRATMPETTIHKNGQPCFGEHEVRSSWNGIVATPSLDAITPEQRKRHPDRMGLGAPRLLPRRILRQLQLLPLSLWIQPRRAAASCSITTFMIPILIAGLAKRMLTKGSNTQDAIGLTATLL